MDDRLWCMSNDEQTNAFCKMELPDARASTMREMHEATESCEYFTIATASGDRLSVEERQALEKDGTNMSNPLYAIYSPHMKQGESLFQEYAHASPAYDDAPISQTDYFYSGVAATLEHCTVHVGADTWWTMERLGPFEGHGGNDWHTGWWWDAGLFADKLATGEVWVTAFGFMPVDASDAPLGSPPVHLHHMHVTSAQWPGGPRPNSEGVVAVEFDLHGDRQCVASSGGTDCLIRAFPTGYGMRVTDPMRTMFDLNDVRPSDSPPLTFYSKHSYKWTRTQQRPVGKFMTATMPFAPIGNHDDFFLLFPHAHKQEYMTWSTSAFSYDASFVRMYWHTHHKHTSDMWVISANASQLGLREVPQTGSLTMNLPWAPHYDAGYVDLTAQKLSTATAMEYVLDRLDKAQLQCAARGCTNEPRVRCMMNKDRWEELPTDDAYWTHSSLKERYHAPHCARWDFKNGDEYTIIAFHSPVEKPRTRDGADHMWMHVVFYGLYVPTEEGAYIPHAYSTT